MGPVTVPRDRFDYVSAISDSSKRQMLQNLLKLRYADAPVFLDVVSVISAYSFTADATLGGQAAAPGRGDQFFGLGAGAAYGDRPTITYTPLSGDKFARSVMSPLPISAVLYLLQSGFPADTVLRICVNEINGLDNAYGGPGNPRPGDPQFAAVLSAVRATQSAGALGIRHKSATERDSLVFAFRSSVEDGAAVATIQKLLGLDPGVREYSVVYGSIPVDDTQIAIVTRSTLQVLVDFASYIDVPALEVEEGRVFAPARSVDQLKRFPPLIRIHNGVQAHADAFISARYRNRWYWIDDRDTQSKLAMTFLLLLFSLNEVGSAQAAAPVVTVPAR